MRNRALSGSVWPERSAASYRVRRLRGGQTELRHMAAQSLSLPQREAQFVLELILNAKALLVSHWRLQPRLRTYVRQADERLAINLMAHKGIGAV